MRRRLTRLRHRLFGHPPELVHAGAVISRCEGCGALWDTK